MKTIEQLLELSNNPYYIMSDAERAVLDDFLLLKSEQKTQHKDNSDSSDSNIHATVLSKNIVKPEHGQIPTVE